MKWVKVAIGAVIAISVIPVIILAAQDTTTVKETREVEFTLLSENGNSYDITPGTFEELLNNKSIINYEIKSSYPLVTQKEIEIANYKLNDEVKNSFIDRETNPRIDIKVGQVTFDGSESWTLYPSSFTKDFVVFFRDLDSNSYLPVYGDASTAISNYLPNVYSNWSGINSESFSLHSELHYIYVGINREKLSSIDVVGFKQYLSQNPLTVTYELEVKNPIEVDGELVEGQPRLAELYDLRTFKLQYDRSSIKVKFDVNDEDYLWEVYNTDKLQPIIGEHEVGNTWTVNFYVYDIQQSSIRNLILLIPLIYISGLLAYLVNTLKRE